MQTHRLAHLGPEMLRQPGRAQRFVLSIDALFGNVLGKIVQEVADIVQQRRRDQCRPGSRPFGEPRSLQRMLVLRDAFAIHRRSAPLVEGHYLLGYAHGSTPRDSTRYRLSTPSLST